jgi:hypothetical protein
LHGVKGRTKRTLIKRLHVAHLAVVYLRLVTMGVSYTSIIHMILVYDTTSTMHSDEGMTPRVLDIGLPATAQE